MATVTKPIALDRSFNTTEVTPRNIADVLAEELSRITGRNASQVEYDNTDSGLTADNVQDAIDEVNGKVPTLPSVDIQTAVDEFSTYNGGLLSSLKVALSPNQDLHGYSEPWVGGAGKNKFEVTATTATEQGVLFNVNSDGTITTTRQSASSNNASIILGDFTLPVGSYKINGANNAGTGGYFTLRKASDNTFIANIESSGYDLNVTDATFEYRLTCVVQSVVSPTGNYETVKPMIRLATETDPTFEPYSNICPISGHTQVDVEVNGKNLLPNIIEQRSTHSFWVGQNSGSTYPFHFEKDKTYAISFDSNYSTSSLYYAESGGADTEIGISGSTFTPSKDMDVDLWIYGGGLSEVSNVQVELGSTATPYVPYNGYQVTVNLGGTYYSGTLDVVSGVLTVDSAFIASYNGETLPSTWISDRDVYAVGTTPTTGAEVCYKLATPTPIQLSPTMVKALVGENHLDAPLEGQEITESKYKQMFTFDDVIAYIQSLS